MKLTIKNSEWLRGTGENLFKNGNKCCAFAAYAQLLGRVPVFFGLDQFDFMNDVAKVNDALYTTDAEKIELLRPILAAHGVEIEYREDL